MGRAAARAPLAGAIAGLGLVAASVASAQPAPQTIPDSVVERMVKLGLEHIHRAVCDGFNTCEPATPEELESPPITLHQPRTAISTGTRTAPAPWRGLGGHRRADG